MEEQSELDTAILDGTQLPNHGTSTATKLR
jgi:hypothetical protein